MASFQELISGEIPVLVDFHAEWCGPCKMMPPILKQVKSELKDTIRILKIDVDKNQKVASHYKISGVPTLMIFKNGNAVWRQSGVIPANQIISQLKSIA